MKLELTEYDYVHENYLTYAEKTSANIEGALSVTPNGLKKSNNTTVLGKLKDILVNGGTSKNTYIEIPQGESIELTFQTADSIIGQIGLFSDSSPTTSANLQIYHQGESASSRYEIKWQHPNGVFYLTANNNTPGTSVALLSEGITIGSGYSFPLFMESVITITNNSAGAEWIRIYHLNFTINHTVKSGVQTKAVYASYGNRIYYNAQTRQAYGVPARVLLSFNQKDTSWDGDNIYASGFGRMYDRWIDYINGSARSNGRNEGDVIHQPAGIVESILRDEVFAERDLLVDTYIDDNHFVCNDLRSTEDDFYKNAIYYNTVTGHYSYVFGYVGSTKTIHLANADFALAPGQTIYFTNIQGDNKINYQSFDLLNNTTNGTRKDWRFTRTLHQEENPASILQKLLYEMRAILFTSHNQYKIVALDEDAGSVDTWTEPLKQNGRYMFSSSLTPLDQLFNDYKIHYDYDYGSGEYRKTLFVNKNGYSEELTNGATYQATCKSIYDDYKRINKFEYYCDWIKGIDYTTGGGYKYHSIAEYFFNKIFAWHSIQRMIVNWAAPVSNYLQYEVGDQVILNNPKLIPTGINNSSKFMIFENPIIPLPGAPIINFKLIEMTDA